ncbi:MAG: PD-(D/E)XK nuclease family protein [Dehalococcoidia bacterium]|nr:PD-(D/E)XK nuclease family protein [Dehalococcoidia bacterium]
MAIQRHFLGWDEPVADKVRQFLLPSQLSGPVDMEGQLIVTPTMEAGRRLREALATHCASQNTALLSPRVVTPAFFLDPEQEPARVASETEVTAVWANVLMTADLSQYSDFFPPPMPEQSFSWAMGTAGLLQTLRDTLAQGGLRIADIHVDYGSILEERERWSDMAGLEAAYLARLAELGLQDRCHMTMRRAERPEPAEGVERIVVAAVPDPTPLTLRALERLASRVDIDVLVHAPESMADHFDEWGRPITEKWNDSEIAIPEADRNVILTASLMSQSRKVVDIMAEESHRFGPADIALGVPNSDIKPFLTADLAEEDLVAFDPAGRSMTGHPLYRLLESFHALVTERTYAGFSAFLRHIDVLTFLNQRHTLATRWLLQELDEFQNERLPLGMEDITRHLALGPRSHERRSGFRNLRRAVAFVQEQLDSFQQQDMDTAVRSLLQTLYEVKTVKPGNPEHDEFIAASELIDDTLRELTSDVIDRLGIHKADALALLLQRLSKQPYYVERKGAVIDLEGWLELPWNGASLMIVTGMNDGFVPDSHLSAVFLPDTLRKQLGLRCDADRLARDAYLMRTLVESHRDEGRVCFLVSKTGATRDPLKPSRLLFRCRDTELVGRARRLFGDPDDEPDSYPPAISFRLRADPPTDTVADGLAPRRLSVTQFRDYLACPFRFYLKIILGMEDLDDEKVEMDALDFGSLVHDVLASMTRSDEMATCEDYVKLADFLCAEAEKHVAERFGRPLPLQIRIQLDAARQRLRAAARVQVGLVKGGWRILDSEVRISAELCGLPVSGRIDRIDRHSQTGEIRILDYKTSDRPRNPEETHLASVVDEIADYMKVSVDGKAKRWIDLQLPLYRILLPRDKYSGSRIEVGYFNLPQAIDETRVMIWQDLDDHLLESAVACAESIIEDIRRRRFWPPIEKVEYDDFESLFPADVPDCVDVEAFEAFMRGDT